MKLLVVINQPNRVGLAAEAFVLFADTSPVVRHVRDDPRGEERKLGFASVSGPGALAGAAR